MGECRFPFRFLIPRLRPTTSISQLQRETFPLSPQICPKPSKRGNPPPLQIPRKHFFGRGQGILGWSGGSLPQPKFSLRHQNAVSQMEKAKGRKGTLARKEDPKVEWKSILNMVYNALKFECDALFTQGLSTFLLQSLRGIRGPPFPVLVVAVFDLYSTRNKSGNRCFQGSSLGTCSPSLVHSAQTSLRRRRSVSREKGKVVSVPKNQAI